MTGMITLVGVKTISGGSSGCKFWSENKPLPGDVVERVSGGARVSLHGPFVGGKAGLQKELRKLFGCSEAVELLVTRGNRRIVFAVTVIQDLASVLKKQYVLAAYNELNYTLVLADGTEDEFHKLQEQSQVQLEEATKHRDIAQREQLMLQLASTQLKDAYMPSYPWEEKMESHLLVAGSASFFSLLVMPYQPNHLVSEYRNLDDTSARATTWFSAAAASGIPAIFSHIQTETLFMQVSANNRQGPREDVTIVASKDYCKLREHDTDFEMLRAVRLWYRSAAPEKAVDLTAKRGEDRLGVGISRTEEGFCFISSVEPNSAADRAGLASLLTCATGIGKLLVLSRVGGEKVTPWVVSSSGAIRCFDTISISQKLSLHRQAGEPLRLHLMIWDSPPSARKDDRNQLASTLHERKPKLLEKIPSFATNDLDEYDHSSIAGYEGSSPGASDSDSNAFDRAGRSSDDFSFSFETPDPPHFEKAIERRLFTNKSFNALYNYHKTNLEAQ